VSVLEKLVREAQERKSRQATVLAAFRALPSPDRQEVLVQLISEFEAGASTPSTATDSAPAVETGGTFAAKAEAFVLAHPEGVSTSAVAQAIGQKPPSTDGTLRSVWKSRRTIERRDGKWLPAANGPAQRRKTHREIIAQVLGAFGPPMGAGEIVAGVQKLDPTRKRESLDAELHRMRTDGLIVAQGVGNRGALYVLEPRGGMISEKS